MRRVIGPAGPELHRALDPARDQSYFLYATTEEQLDFLRFPLGGLPKQRSARASPRKSAWRVAAKPDSQDICFVPDGDYAKIVTHDAPRRRRARARSSMPRPAKCWASIAGVIHFTVGQRRGLEIGGQPEPLYVVGLDAEAARSAASGPSGMLAVGAAQLVETNRIGPLPDAAADGQGPLAGQAGAGHARRPARRRRGDARSASPSPNIGVAPGQAAVIYAGDRVVGGGWIEATDRGLPEPLSRPTARARSHSLCDRSRSGSRAAGRWR